MLGELGRLEKKAKKREAQLENIKKEKTKLEKEFLDKVETKAITSRTEYYRQMLVPTKTYPRIATKIGKLSLLSLLKETTDLMYIIIPNLSPKEYQSLSMTSKYFQKLLHSRSMLNKLVESVIDYMVNVEKDPTELLEKKEAHISSQVLLQMAVEQISRLLCRGGPVEHFVVKNRIPYSQIPQKKLHFINTKTGEFGDVSGEIFYSKGDWPEGSKRDEFYGKYGFKCDRNILDATDLKKIEFISIDSPPLDKHVLCDIYLRNHACIHNYYQCLTRSKHNIIFFYYTDPNDHVDLYYDWFIIRRLFRFCHPSWVRL